MYELRSRLENAKEILIYGAGDYGQTFIRYFYNEKSIYEKIIAVVVSDQVLIEQVEGIPVRQLCDIDQCNDMIEVIVAVSLEKQSDIMECLKKCNYSNYYCIKESQYMIMKRTNFNNYKKREQYIKEIYKGLDEVIYAHNFDRAIVGCDWISDRDIKARGMAVSHHYLYTMLQILRTKKFKKILDIGMGSTTKLISQYAAKNEEVIHFIVEADIEWEDYMQGLGGYCLLPDNSKIIHMEYGLIERDNSKVRCFSDFKERMKENKFDFISIDAPFGGDMTSYSRIDMLDILPECLEKSWVIMIDDVDRVPEKNTVALIEKCMQENEIEYVYREHYDIHAFGIFASMDNKFLSTI